MRVSLQSERGLELHVMSMVVISRTETTWGATEHNWRKSKARSPRSSVVAHEGVAGAIATSGAKFEPNQVQSPDSPSCWLMVDGWGPGPGWLYRFSLESASSKCNWPRLKHGVKAIIQYIIYCIKGYAVVKTTRVLYSR